MKIAFASDDEQTISAHFGRTRGFVIFDIENNKIKNKEYRLNTFTGHVRGLEGSDHSIDRHAPILEALKDCQAVISHGMGMRIYDDLKNADIEVFITDLTDIKSALNNYLKGALDDNPDKGCEHKQKKECES